jgi:hypothetical protein
VGELQLPAEWELISFFETDPDPIERRDREEAEFFGTVSFTKDVGGGEVLSWNVSVPFRHLHVSIYRDGVDRVSLAARDVARIRLERPHGNEELVADYGPDRNRQRARLTLRPTFRLEWGLET